MNQKTRNVSGEMLKILRLIKGGKQTAIAQKLSVEQQSVSKIEKRKEVDDETIDVYLIAYKSNFEELEVIRKLLAPPH